MEYFVHALFHQEASAERAVRSLVDAHFDPARISALMRCEREVEEAAPVFKVAVGRGAALGAALGVIGGAVLASGGLLLAGPLAAAAAGGLTGTLAGALGGLGRWTDEIDFREAAHEDAHAGMILVGVSTEERSIERAREALAAARPERIHLSQKGEACQEVETGILSETGLLSGRQ